MSKPRVLILGDVMLDRHVRGRATHLAPDHPCVCFTPDETIDRPGGAANVALNVAAAGMDATLIAFTGMDQEKEDLYAAMQWTQRAAPVSLKIVLIDSRVRATHMKTRYVCGRPARPLLRVDRPRGTTPRRLTSTDLARLEEHLAVYGVGMFSMAVLADYGHGGVVRELGDLLRRYLAPGATICVDPHSSTAPGEYAYADLIKMNRDEEQHLRTYCHPDEWLNPERLCIVTAGASATRVWRGEHTTHGETSYMPPTGLSIADPCGAGDVFVARLAAGMLRGTFEDAIADAHIAAAVSVGREFTTVVYDADADYQEARARFYRAS